MAPRPIREVTFSGTPYERGLQRGRRLRPTFAVPRLPELPAEFVRLCRRAAEALHPAVAGEFEGIVAGGGYDRDVMEAYYFARLEGQLGCTMFAVLSEAGGVIVGRNYDWAVGDLRWCELHRYLPARAGPDSPLSRIGYTHHWAACTDLLNEAGLYVAVASLPGKPAALPPPGAQWHVIVDAISEQCRSVPEAVGLCAGARHLRPMSYLLADSAGRAAVVEAEPRQVRVRELDGPYLVAANAALGGILLADHPEAPPICGAAPAVIARAHRRIKRVAELLEQRASRLTDEWARRVLCDHEAPVCTGNHSHPDGAPWGTIYSAVCVPAERRLWIAPGLPCRQRYSCFSLAPAAS